MPTIASFSNNPDIDAQRTSNVSLERVFEDIALHGKLTGTNDISTNKDVAAVRASVKNLVLTNFHERPFQPFLGGNLFALLFEPINPFTTFTIQTEVMRVLSEYEPRIKDIKVKVTPKEEQNYFFIDVYFTVKNSNQETSVQLKLTRIR